MQIWNSCNISLARSSDGIPGFNTYTTFRLVWNGYVLPIVIFFGLLGNAHIIAVLVRSRSWRKLRPYLGALVFWDIVLLVWSAHGLCFMYWYRQYYTNFRAGKDLSLLNVSQFGYVFMNMALTGRIWVTVAMTSARYWAICHPFYAKSKVLPRRLRQAPFSIVLVCLLAVAYNCPRFFETDIIHCWDIGILIVGQSPLYANSGYYVTYRIGCGVVFMLAGPLLALAVMTLRIVYSIRQSLHSAMKPKRTLSVARRTVAIWQECNRNGALSSHSRSMLIVIVSSVLCYTLPTCMDIVEYFVPDDLRNHTLHFDYAVGVSNGLVVFNSAASFYVYCACGGRFRREVAALWRCRSRNHSGALIPSDSSFSRASWMARTS